MNPVNKSERIQDAAAWLGRLETGTAADRRAFIDWLSRDAQHVDQLLALQALIVEARAAVRSNLEYVHGVLRNADRRVRLS